MQQQKPVLIYGISKAEAARLRREAEERRTPQGDSLFTGIRKFFR